MRTERSGRLIQRGGRLNGDEGERDSFHNRRGQARAEVAHAIAAIGGVKPECAAATVVRGIRMRHARDPIELQWD